ncbi:hypothetical protein ATN83_2642 [Raoultella ornithinolytica]|nr:hypothetical protein ATN83_2642 [Raoultella ornithinolytica]
MPLFVFICTRIYRCLAIVVFSATDLRGLFLICSNCML